MLEASMKKLSKIVKALIAVSIATLVIASCANPLQSSFTSESTGASKSLTVGDPRKVPGNYVSLGTGPQNKKDGTEVLVPGASSNIDSKIQEIAPDGYPVLNQKYGPLTVTKLYTKATGEVYGFDFVSEIPIIGIYLKGGSEGGNFYNSSPDGATSGTVVTPLTGKDGKGGNAAISHWIFAWMPRPLVTITANATFDRDWNWTIRKTNNLVADGNSSANPAMMVAGGSLAVTYNVSGNATSVDKNFLVQGVVTVTNPAYNKTSASLSGINIAVPNGSGAVEGTFPVTIAAGASSVAFNYSASPTIKTDGAVTATTVAGSSSKVLTSSASASFAFGDTPKNQFDTSIAISDSLVSEAARTIGLADLTSGAYSFTYDYSISAPAAGDAVLIRNTASYVASTSDGEANDRGPASSDVWVKLNDTTPPPSTFPPFTSKSDTGWARLDGHSLDFITDINLVANNWGWTNGPLSAGTYTANLYVGAAQSDITNRKLAGTVTFEYEGNKVTVTYSMYPGYYLNKTQLYVGTDKLPKTNKGQYTSSSGQLGNQHPLNYATSDSYTLYGFSEYIYFAAHAEVLY